MSRPFTHVPVLAGAVVDIFRPVAGGVIVDATLGGGGHSALLLEELGPQTHVLGIDRDPAALAAARQRLDTFGDRVRFVRGDFRDIAPIVRQVVRQEERNSVQGVLLDLGVSSPQLDMGERGFSYTKPAPLDMRMDPDSPRTAAHIVNETAQYDLRHLLRAYGEERFAGRIAAAIVRNRPFATTVQLAEVVRAAIPAAARRTGPHPARRTFQALRIVVNDELAALDAGLNGAVDVLAAGGRLVVISYHSLEDRMVKLFLRANSQPQIHPRGLPITQDRDDMRVIPLFLLNTRPIVPSAGEIASNPRADSAKLRAAEKRGAAA